ncbi:MAG: metallophosphoesterase [Candidatus Nanopelagicales bacterium]
MRLHVVSDVHDQVAGLAEAGDDCDVFVCLGDLVLFLDYEDPGSGIFADLFGRANAQRYIDLRYQLRFDEARAFSRELWEAIGAEPWSAISQAVGAQYSRLFAALPGGLFTYGNVDIPALWPDHLRPDQRVLDGESVEVGGLRLGFVGGGLRTPMRTPFEISDEEFAAKVERLGEVDVLFSHIPPAVPEATYDVVARRLERGSRALRDYIADVQPRFAFHGHVHQPLVPRVSIGRTQVVNVGHYRSRRVPYAVTID